MSLDASLFGDDEPQQRTTASNHPAPIAAWQIDLLRKALDARGVSSMAQRQRLIEDVVGRQVDSLRALTAEEANRALATLGDAAPARSGGSRWDERGEDTWIDRL